MKILVIGCPGAGKSTFARKLAAKTGLPLHYLDMIWHKPDRTTATREEFDSKLEEILATDDWIIDGNYRRTLPRRLQEADMVFLFDLPADICLAGATERLAKKREEMPWNDTELDEDFRERIVNFHEREFPEIKTLLEKFTGQTIRFTQRDQTDIFIDRLI